MRKYKFTKELIGDLVLGRPNLGVKTDVEMYRLMLFSLRDVIEQKFGSKEADEIFFEAGKIAGSYFYETYIAPVISAEDFFSKIQKVLKEKKIAILRIEEVLLDSGTVLLTIDEDLECSGLLEIDHEICIYDEGFLSAIFEKYTGEKWLAKEIDCWGTGSRTCRFIVTKQ